MCTHTYIHRAARWLSAKNSACDTGDVGSSPDLGRVPGEEMATHSSILDWEIPWTEESGRLLSMRLKNNQTRLSN